MRHRLHNALERRCNPRVVRRRHRKRRPRQPPPRRPSQPAAIRNHLFRNRCVIGNRRHNRHIFKILRRRAHHRRSTDIDVFNHIAERHPRPARRLLKRIQVHHHHVDRLDRVLSHRRHMLRISAHMQNPAVHLGMQRLHPAVQHLRKAGQVADIAHRQPRLAQRPRRPAGRNQLHAVPRQRPRKLHQPGLVRNRKQRPPNPLHSAHILNHSRRNRLSCHALNSSRPGPLSSQPAINPAYTSHEGQAHGVAGTSGADPI